MQSKSLLSKNELLKHPNYLLSTYQLKIYSLLTSYMKDNGLKKQKEVAERLGVSDAYVSQILGGECNFSLKKLIELGLKLGKVPYLEFTTPEEYFYMEAKEVRNKKNNLEAARTTSGESIGVAVSYRPQNALRIAYLINNIQGTPVNSPSNNSSRNTKSIDVAKAV